MQLPEPSDPPIQTNSRAAWTDEGEGATVVALHGLPGRSRDYRWLGGIIEHKLRLVRLETPGFGACPELAEMNASHCIEHFLRTMDDLQLEKVVVMGHSFGGALAMRLAATAPERVAGLALLAPVGLRPHKLWRKSVLAMKGFHRAMGVPGIGRIAGAVALKAFRSTGFHLDGDELRAALAMIDAWRFAESRALVDQVRCPVFAASTLDDEFIEPPVIAELLAAMPAGPHHVFEEGGHSLQKSQAIPIAEVLVPWVQECLTLRAACD